MRSAVPEFHLEMAQTLGDATKLLASEPGTWSVLAGGTDVMVLYEAGFLKQRRWLSINQLSELKGINVTKDFVELGALTTYTDIREHPALRAEFPSLYQAASETGGLAIQNRGTIGGNIANASPAADTPPALLVYDAEILLTSAIGERWVTYDTFHTAYKKTVMRPDEIVARVRLPRGRGPLEHYYRKVGTRKAQAISKVVICGAVKKSGGLISDVRLTLGSVAPTTVRLLRIEALLEGQRPSSTLRQKAVDMLAKEIKPIDDIRSTASFRLHVAGNVLSSYLAGLE